MRRFILKEEQLIEYVKNKKAEKVFYEIVEKIHQNQKFLNEIVSHKKANQSIIDNYKNKNLLTPKVSEMLIKYGIIDENHEIIQ